MDGPALLTALMEDKQVRPIESVDELAGEGIFDTDEELGEFLLVGVGRAEGSSRIVVQASVLDTDVASPVFKLKLPSGLRTRDSTLRSMCRSATADRSDVAPLATLDRQGLRGLRRVRVSGAPRVSNVRINTM